MDSQLFMGGVSAYTATVGVTCSCLIDPWLVTMEIVWLWPAYNYITFFGE